MSEKLLLCLCFQNSVRKKKSVISYLNCLKRMLLFLAAVLSTHVMKVVIRRVPMEKESLMLIVWVSHKKPINHHSGNGVHRKQGSAASPICCRYVLSSELCHLFLGHLESSFVAFQVWLVGFLTKTSNLHHILFFSYTLSHNMISEDCARGCGSGRCLICVSLWWQKPLVTYFHPYVVPLGAVLWSRSRGTCGWKIILKEKVFSVAGLVPMTI